MMSAPFDGLFVDTAKYSGYVGHHLDEKANEVVQQASTWTHKYEITDLKR